MNKLLIELEAKRVRQIGWILTLVLIVVMICTTILWIYSHPFVFRFEMDNNTLEAIKSINWTAIGNQTK